MIPCYEAGGQDTDQTLAVTAVRTYGRGTAQRGRALPGTPRQGTARRGTARHGST